MKIFLSFIFLTSSIIHAKEQKFDNRGYINKQTLKWECDSLKRNLNLVHSNLERHNMGSFVSDFNSVSKCQKIATELNHKIPRIVDQNGNYYPQNLLVCIKNLNRTQFYIVSQDIPLEEIQLKGKEVTSKYSLGTDDCHELPLKFLKARPSFFNGLALGLKKERVSLHLDSIKESQEEYILDHFTYED